MTTDSDMRGSTLLLHWKVKPLLIIVQLRSALHLSRIADLAPLVGSLLSLAGYSSSSSLGYGFIGYGFSITEMGKVCKPFPSSPLMYLLALSCLFSGYFFP